MLSVTLPDQTKMEITLEDICREKKYTILYFYPKDNTPWCSLEAAWFSQLVNDFWQFDTQIIGVSKDSYESHCNFQEKHWLNFSLISDSDLALHQDPRFATWKEKTSFGKTYMGTSRDTFVLDQKGSVLKERRKVTPAIHPQEVLDYVRGL